MTTKADVLAAIGKVDDAHNAYLRTSKAYLKGSGWMKGSVVGWWHPTHGKHHSLSGALFLAMKDDDEEPTA